MAVFFNVITIATSIIAIVTFLMFLIGLLLGSKTLSSSEVFLNCNSQTRVCRICSILFVAMYWFLVSGYSTEKCLEAYTGLSALTLKLGSIWMVLALLDIIVGVIMSLQKKSTKGLEIAKIIRRSSFLMAGILFLISFLLNVN